MVAKVHHAVAKKAQKAGITITGEAEDQAYTIHWVEGNKKFLAEDAKAGLDDMILWRMLTLEHTGLKVTFTKGEFTIKQGRTTLAGPSTSLQEAWDIANEQEEGEGDEGEQEEGEQEEGEQEEGEEGEENGESKSIVKPKFRQLYKPHQHTCGDQLTQDLREYLVVTGKDGKEHLDAAKLKRFAKANGVWQDKYSNLNNGQVRMNVGNRIRKLAKAEDFEIQWPR